MSMDQHPFLIQFGPNVSAAVVKAVTEAYPEAIIPGSVSCFQSGSPFSELFYGEPERFEEHQKLLKDARVVVIQSASEDDHTGILHAGLMSSTLKTYGVKEVTALMPFRAFDRQDRPFGRRFCSVGADWFAGMLKHTSLVDRMVSLTPHSVGAQKIYESYFGAENVVGVSTIPLLAKALESERVEGRLIVPGAPDGADKPKDAGIARARELFLALNPEATPEEQDAGIFKILKKHDGASETKCFLTSGEVAGATCALVDDMIDGGGTIVNAANAVKDKGAARVVALASHAVMSRGAFKKILCATRADGMPVIDRLVMLDTIPNVHQKLEVFRYKFPEEAARVEIVSCAPLILEQLKALEIEKSQEKSFARFCTPQAVTSLFNSKPQALGLPIAR